MEQRRQALEELERIEAALAERIAHDPNWLPTGYSLPPNSLLKGRTRRTQRETVLQQLEAAKLVHRYNDLAKTTTLNSESVVIPSVEELLSLIKDIPEAGNAASLEGLFQRHTNSAGLGRYLSDFTDDMAIDKIFKDTEDYGKLVDLMDLHAKFVNIKGAPHLTYREYVDKVAAFDDFLYFPVKGTAGFNDYIRDLETYLFGFYERAYPLGTPPRKLPAVQQAIDEVKQQESDSDLFCQACQKQFASEGVFRAHLTGKKHLRAAASMQSTAAEKGTQKSAQEGAGSIDVSMAAITALAKELEPILKATKYNIDRRAGLTEQERKLEADNRAKDLIMQDEQVSEYESDGEESIGESLPIGADGEPVPRWLFKLQGLGMEYACEICGEYVYRGRKAYERHFTEPRHLHGLKCLGIVSSPAFRGITGITEATELARKLRTEKEPLDDIQVEDKNGNVMTAKVFDDLQRQGLL